MEQQPHAWASEIISLYRKLGSSSPRHMIYEKQCLLFKSLVDCVAYYVEHWWIGLFRDQTSSEAATAVGTELARVLKDGEELLQTCARKVQPDVHCYSIVLRSAGEFPEILENVKRYAWMMNFLIIPESPQKEEMLGQLKRKVECDYSTLQTSLVWACKEDRQALIDSFRSFKVSRWTYKKSISRVMPFILGEGQQEQEQEQDEGGPKVPTIDSKDIAYSKKVLGEGPFGKVTRAIWGNLPVAVKEFNSESSFNNGLREFETLLPNYPSHVAQVLGHSEKEGKKVLVLELMDKDLNELIEKKEITSILESVDIMLQIATGMKQLYNSNVIYRDLKPSNVLIKRRKDKSLLIKLADFGIARAGFWTGLSNTQYAGTMMYMAPEVLEEVILYTRKVDVFSFAMVSCQILTGKTPFPSEDIDKMNDHLDKKGNLENWKRPTLPSGNATLNSLQELIKCCWQYKADERPSFEQICDKLWDVKLELLTKGPNDVGETSGDVDHKNKGKCIHWVANHSILY